MVYAYNSKIYLAEAVLNVKDLAGQVAFYTQIIGLEIQTQTEREVILGAGNKPLVHLIQVKLWSLPYGNLVAVSRGFGRCFQTYCRAGLSFCRGC